MSIFSFSFRIALTFLLILWVGLFLACSEDLVKNNNQNSEVKKDISTPIETPSQIPTSIPILRESEKTDRNSHENLYKQKLEIISVVNSLTKLNEKFLTREPSIAEHIKREKEIFKLVDKLRQNAFDLITLAKICRIMEIHGQGSNKSVSPYDIAFFYCVKILATTYKSDQKVKSEIEELKKLNIDGHLAEEFTLALEGKNSSFLYSENSENVKEQK